MLHMYIVDNFLEILLLFLQNMRYILKFSDLSPHYLLHSLNRC